MTLDKEGVMEEITLCIPKRYAQGLWCACSKARLRKFEVEDPRFFSRKGRAGPRK
jgi:hypothetical protein